MIRFAEFEAHGPVLAGMTEARDGDFSLEGIRNGYGDLEALSGVLLDGIQVVSQVHGRSILRAVPGTSGLRLLGEGDGLVANFRGTALAIRIADCVPLYLYDPMLRCGGLVHAGREGTRLKVAREAVKNMIRHFGSSASSLFALIGPSAGPCCYEVDPETARRCAADGMRVKGRFVDLWSSNRDQLAASGVPSVNIDIAGVCTICNPAFHSYRRTRTNLRNLALLVL